jgi:hypothetical protein
MHCTSNLLVRKNKTPTIEKKKILIPFIMLGFRPTSTPGLERDQLVHFLHYITYEEPKRDRTFNDDIFEEPI